MFPEGLRGDWRRRDKGREGGEKAKEEKEKEEKERERKRERERERRRDQFISTTNGG
jgi:hypothetical protein